MLLSEGERALCHPAGADKSSEICPEEHRRASGGESFWPNPGRCHCHGAPSRPIAHGTVLTERSFYQKGYCTLRLRFLRGVEVEAEAEEEEEEEEDEEEEERAGGMRWER